MMPLPRTGMKRRKSKGDRDIQTFGTLSINGDWTGLCELTWEAERVVNHGHPHMLHKLGGTAELWQHLQQLSFPGHHSQKWVLPSKCPPAPEHMQTCERGKNLFSCLCNDFHLTTLPWKPFPSSPPPTWLFAQCTRSFRAQIFMHYWLSKLEASKSLLGASLSEFLIQLVSVSMLRIATLEHISHPDSM